MGLLGDQAVELFNVVLTPAQEEQFARYAEALVSWNARTNLTTIVEPEGVRVRHFLDSLSIVLAQPVTDGLRMVDVGTGAGFPGLPLHIAYPQTHVTLMDSTGKKVAFLDHVIQTLGLTGAATLHARAEDAGHMPEHRASYDLVLARSVARLPALAEYLLPLACVGGKCIAMKGRTAASEAQDAARAIDLLGGRVSDILPVALPGVEEPHYLVVIDKVAHTPSVYPRQAGTPTRKPLI